VTEVAQARKSRLRKFEYWTAALLAAAWLFGLASFVAADGHFEATLPRLRPPAPGLQNLALWDLGPTVRASSFYGDWLSHHHPLFVVDGREHPDLVEKWACGEHDLHPFIEITWRELHDIERVVIRHAGWIESAALTARRYTIRTLTATGYGPSQDVDSNQEAVASYDLTCRGSRGIRIEFKRNKGDDIVRVYEVEAWGR